MNIYIFIFSQSDALSKLLTIHATSVLEGLDFSDIYHRTTIFAQEDNQQIIYERHLENPGLVVISMATNFMGFTGQSYAKYSDWVPYQDICPLSHCMAQMKSTCRLKTYSISQFYKIIRDYTEQGEVNFGFC